MIHSYVGPRGKDRAIDALVTRHAVDEVAHLCGAHDTVCGRAAMFHLGPWVPDDPRNCQRCTRMIARVEENVA